MQHDFKQLLLKMVGGFAAVNRENFERLVQEALKVYGIHCHADCLCLYTYDFEDAVAFNAHQWCSKMNKFHPDDALFIPLDRIEPVVDCHRRGEDVYLASINGADNIVDITNFSKKLEVKSLALFPLASGERCLGFLCLKYTRQSREQTPTEVFLFKALAEMLTGSMLRLEREKEIMAQNSTYADLVEQAGDWIWKVDDNGFFTYVNSRMIKITGYSTEDFIGKEFFSFMPEIEEKKTRLAFFQAMQSALPIIQYENRFVHKNGHEIVIETNALPVHDREGQVSGLKGISREVTEQVVSRQKMEYLSMHDQLTGLYNRTFFEEKLHSLQESRNYPVTMIYIDVNNMKAVNDAFGHEKGDQILKAAASILRQSLRNSEILARVGGDEFVAVLMGTDKEIGQRIIERIKSRLVQYNSENKTTHLSFSMGMATSHSSETSLQELLKTADDMMYRDKILNGRTERFQGIDPLVNSYLEKGQAGTSSSRLLALLCRELGKKLSLDLKKLNNLDLLVKAHNLGKAGISKKILYKQGSLSKEEQNIICLHPEKGYRIALTSSQLSSIADLILKHHEWWDGNGYPLGLRGEEIPIECRILAVADAFAAMTEGRVYKQACSGEKALEELKNCAETQFDPGVVKAFCELYTEPGLSGLSESQ